MADDAISKTRRKRAMHDLQDLGEALVELSSERLAALALPEPLGEAVREARRLKSFGARRRQAQYIGRLMREVDPAPIRARIDAWEGNSRAHAAWLHDLERWRERLLTDGQTLTELAQKFPGADLQHLHTLVRNAREDAASGKPPKHYRALFRALKELMPEPAPDVEAQG
ncbi:MAG: ribosome biogenesis factor YjgA [Burkholderiales bacterium]